MNFFTLTIKDVVDVLLVAALLFYIYRTMKKSNSLNMFFGVLTFIIFWIVLSLVLKMKLIGTILDMIKNIGLIALVILFQDQIRVFLSEIGSSKKWKYFKRFSSNKNNEQVTQKWIMSIVKACMSMSKSKTGALIVVQKHTPLNEYIHTGDVIDANVNNRLLQNIFFKNSPLHDGAVIISGGKIKAAGCILPVSHQMNISRSLGLRHRSAIGVTEASDSIAIVVSEETGNISYAYKGEIHTKLSSTDLEQRLSDLMKE